MVRFSIVLPMLDANAQFENSLASILRYCPESTQIIVPHIASVDDNYGLGKEVEFVVSNRPQLIPMFNSGLRQARGQFVALFRPGIELTNELLNDVEQHFENESVGSVSPAIVSANARGRLVSAGVSTNYKQDRLLVGLGRRVATRRTAGLSPIGPTSWAAFYRRSLLNSLGSCDEQLDASYMDLDLALSLKNLRFDCRFDPNLKVTIDEPELIKTESKLPAGRSAQRILNRQMDLSGNNQLLRTCVAGLAEIGSSLWRPGKGKHALQRVGALSLRKIDRHHWNLLTVLNSQRLRLVTAETQIQNRIDVSNVDKPSRKAA